MSSSELIWESVFFTPVTGDNHKLTAYTMLGYGVLDMAVTAGLLLEIVAFIGIFTIETMEGQPARRTT